jgi:transcriptional regulator with XRE-family HTH domain
MSRQRLPSLNARIRTMRQKLGLTGAELAQRANISPSYVSLIESGAKVPDEDVAARIARVLRDEEDLYRAWARASRVGLHKLNLLSRMEAISRSPEYLGLLERGESLPGGAEAEPGFIGGAARSAVYSVVEPASVAAPEPSREREGSPPAPTPNDPGAEPEVLRVPVLAAGADPGRLAPSPVAVTGHLLLDPRLVADHAADRLFACEATGRDMKHLRGLLSPGDRVVFRRGGRVSPDRICAVRGPGGLVLSRVLFKGRSLLLLPGEGERDFESVDVDGLKALPGIIAGTHVLLIRR